MADAVNPLKMQVPDKPESDTGPAEEERCAFSTLPHGRSGP